MGEVLGILGVAGLFLLRVGIPVLLLVGLGMLIDRWQTRREAQSQRAVRPVIEFKEIKEAKAEEEEEERKAA